jgi:hypothetical protein
MVVIHANDPTTRILSQLYKSRNDVTKYISESNTNAEVKNAVRFDTPILMLGHGNQHGLFSKPNKKGVYERFLITDRHVQFLRDKVCIGIWCYANEFAEHYRLKGLFSGMIISEVKEAVNNQIEASKEEIDSEMELFTQRLKYCIEHYELKDVPAKMLELDNIQSQLTQFNYSRLFYYG